MRNYIEFYYDTDDYLTAEIHKDGRIRTIRNPNRLDKLMEICERNGFPILGETKIKRNVQKITKQYENHVKRIKRLQILGEITDNMKLSLKNISLGKKVVAISLAGAITIAGIGLNKINAQELEDKEYHGAEIGMHSEREEPTRIRIDGLENEIDILLEEDTIEETEVEENTTEKEIDAMFQEDAFHFSYEKRIGNESYQNAIRYEDLFEKYAKMYGLDKNLLIAIASQESSGDHYNNLTGGPAVGIMQIEKGPNVGQSVEVYNFELGGKEKIEITLDKLQDLEQNIKIGAALLRYSIVYNDYNITIGLQNYNMGFGNMGKVLEACSTSENIQTDDLRNSQTNNAWLEYRNHAEGGDPLYVEHIFSYMPDNAKITVNDTLGNEYSVLIHNDFVKEAEKANF